MLISKIILLYIFVIGAIDGTHFLGGTITWRPLNDSATGSPVSIVVTQTYLWNFAKINCTNEMIENNSFVPDYRAGSLLSTSKLQCISQCGNGSSGYSPIYVIPRCTDFSVPGKTTVGQRSDIVNLTSYDDFSIAYADSWWRPLATDASAAWSISTRINLQPRSDNGLYNHAPVATMMSPIYIPFNKTIAIYVPVADADGDTLRCRWATKSNGVDECADACPPSSLPPGTIIYPNCTIIVTGKNISDWYAVAVVVEDFINSTSTTPLSSVPVQFLVQVVAPSSCGIPPEVVGIPLEQSCTPIGVNQTFNSMLIAINNCGPSVTIVDISTLSFAGVIQSSVIAQNSTTYYKSFTWTPSEAQTGYQVMCAMAFDSQNTQSAQYCFTFYVSEDGTSGCPGEITTTTETTTTSTSTTSTTDTTATTSSTSSTSSTTSTTTSTSTTKTTSSTTSVSTTTETTSSTSSTTSTSTTTETTSRTSSTTSTSTTTETTSSTSSTTSTSTTTESTSTTSSTTSKTTSTETTSTTSSTSSTSTTTETTSSTSSTTSTSSSTTTTSSTTSSSSTTETTSTTSSSTSTTTSSTTTTTTSTTTSSSTSTSTTSSTSTTTTSSSTSTSTSTSSTSTSTTSTTATTTTTSAGTTTKPKSNPVNWLLITGLSLLAILAALACCCCLCWYFLCPPVIGGDICNDATPILYHIERCTDPNCSWSETWSSRDAVSSRSTANFNYKNLDKSNNIYTNIGQLSSSSPINRVLRLSNTESIFSISSFRNSLLSLSPSNESSTKPISSVSVYKVKLRDREYSVGNPAIKQPNREADEAETTTPSKMETRSHTVRVSRIKSTKKQSNSAHKSLDKSFVGGKKESVHVTRVRSVLFNTPCPSSLNESLSTFHDTIYLNNSDESKKRKTDSSQPDVSIKSAFSSSIKEDETTSVVSKSTSPTSVIAHIRVDRIPMIKRMVKKRPSTSLSILGGIQKQKINQHHVTRVRRISRQNTT